MPRLHDSVTERDLIGSSVKTGDVVFDVGAYIGLWSDIALEFHPIVIHMFEPFHQHCEELRRKFNSLVLKENVVINEVALSDEEGYHDYYFYPENPSFSTFYRREVSEKKHNFSGPNPPISVPTISLDKYCEVNHVDHINYLKIDVEGAEKDVIRGAKKLICNGKINFIEFEYGETYSDAGIKLEEIYKFLKSKGNYDIFRAFANGAVHMPSFRPQDEDYMYSNLIACSPNVTFKGKIR